MTGREDTTWMVCGPSPGMSKAMVTLPGVELASSMAACKVQLPSPLSQIPSPRLVSGPPPIELTVNVAPLPGAGVLVGVGVGVLVGVLVGAPIRVGVGVSVGVGVRPTERVLVGVGVLTVEVGVAPDTSVGVTLGVGVAVADDARVGVEVASSRHRLRVSRVPEREPTILVRL